jgi:hypothetical protein
MHKQTFQSQKYLWFATRSVKLDANEDNIIGRLSLEDNYLQFYLNHGDNEGDSFFRLNYASAHHDQYQIPIGLVPFSENIFYVVTHSSNDEAKTNIIYVKSSLFIHFKTINYG